MYFFSRESRVESRWPKEFGARQLSGIRRSTLDLRHACAALRRGKHAFTLIEIMIVVAIIGMVAAMGMPSIMKAIQKEGMRKALSDVTDVCASARAKAIWTQQPVAVVFHPLPEDRSFEVQGGGEGHNTTYVHSGQLPDGVNFAMLDIEQQDYGASKDAYVWFFPNGTANEAKIILIKGAEKYEISVEFATGMARVSDVNR